MYPDSLSTGLVTWLGRAIVSETPPPSAAVATAAADAGGSMWLYLLGGGSLVTILGMLGKAFSGWHSGRASDETRREAGLVLQRDTAWDERDKERESRIKADQRAACEVRNTRLALDYAARLRRQLIENSIAPKVEEPELETCD